VIWFACSKCRKVHGRPENAAGAMVFCDCGQGMTVPWESTAPEPAHAPAVATPQPRRAEPLTFGAAETPSSVVVPPPRSARRKVRFEHDANVCLNHEARPKQKVCADCGMSFCDDCVVAFRGQTLCGPCKNYETKLLQRPPRRSGLAIASAAVALAAGLLVACMPWNKPMVFSVIATIALSVQVLAFFAGLFALRKTQSDPQAGGQGLAITGMAAASFMAVLTVVLTLYAQKLGS
jgi:hypothetical protein